MNKWILIKLPVLLVFTLLLTGCVIMVPVTIFLQNSTNQPVLARLRYRELTSTDSAGLPDYKAKFSKGLRYSPKTIKPSRRAARQLTDTLSVSATDTAATFLIPPHATVLLVSTYSTSHFMLPAEAKLYLQATQGTTQVLDAERFRQAAQLRRGAFCYYIHLPTP